MSADTQRKRTIAIPQQTASWLVRCCAFIATSLSLPACAPKTAEPTVVAGDARFEFLTPALVRMEYAPGGQFVDAPTAVVQKRGWPKVQVQRSQIDGWLTARTSSVTLRYRLQSGRFTKENLEITWSDAHANLHKWHPGDRDSQNLGGLPYSLDHVSEENLPADRSDTLTPVNDIIPGIEIPLLEATPGLLSRSGYALLDDSRTPVWNGQNTWIEPRTQNDSQDWYLFTYDQNYQQVLRDYASLCGPVPMIPRYVLGPLVTDFNFEYFPNSAEAQTPEFMRYNQQYLEDEMSRLRGYQIPFDSLVLDFAWHNYGWDGGYDWSPLIPQPAEFLEFLHDRGIKIGLNDHPGYANTRESILSYEDSHAPAVLKALGAELAPRASLSLDLSKGAQFAPDPHDVGLAEQWYRSGHKTPPWKAIRVGQSWQQQGYQDDAGPGWYRLTARLPAHVPATLYLYLGETRKDYRIFVNGQESRHNVIQWPQRLTYTDISGLVKPGKTNEIVLRVESGEEGGGLLLAPVAILDVPPPDRIYFDLSNQKQAEVFMHEVHDPLMHAGVDFWWVDGGSGALDMPGLNKQLWTNKVFYDSSQQQSGKRAFILGRYGDWGSERYPGYFTGDTYSQWPVLAYEVALSTRSGNVLVPYVSHDIGGFHDAKIDFDLYARWIEFGAFSPILRMHSAHANPREGNMRMPWVYGDAGVALMKKYFTLHTQLIPYLYTYTWLAHRDATPLLRPLYLIYPQLDEAYRHSHEYLLGDEMLVAPIVEPGGDETIYLPPGEWLDFFTGKHHAGASTFKAHYAVDETPVFVRDGAIIPEQLPSAYSDARPLDTVLLHIYGSGAGHFDLYEDDGVSLNADQGKSAVTSITYATDHGEHRLVIAAPEGKFPGQVSTRTWELHLHMDAAPHSIAVNGRQAGTVSWDAASSTAVVSLPALPVTQKAEVVWH
jgi:alpha-glucosidase (family GH31 glycosyl hydrolase)